MPHSRQKTAGKSRRQKTGGRKLEAESWRQKTGGRKLQAENWRQKAAGEKRLTKSGGQNHCLKFNIFFIKYRVCGKIDVLFCYSDKVSQ